MKHRKIKILLLCMAVAGVMAGCGAGDKTKSDDSKVTASDNKTSSTQEDTSTDSGMADKDADKAKEDETAGSAADTKDMQEDKSTADSSGDNAAMTDDTGTDKSDTAGTADAATSESAQSDGTDGKDTAVWKFTNQDLEGNEVTQDIFKDKKLTMVNYWATFCGPCLREMPELGELNEEYADKGFQIVGVVADVMEDQNGELTNLDVAKDAVEATKADYVHMPLTMDMLSGPVSNVQVVPTTVFVDENGSMVGEEQLGSKSKEDWAALIDSYLEKV